MKQKKFMLIMYPQLITELLVIFVLIIFVLHSTEYLLTSFRNFYIKINKVGLRNT